MKRVLVSVLVLAFVATMAMGFYVSKAAAKSEIAPATARITINRNNHVYNVLDMTRTQIMNRSDISRTIDRGNVMRLRPIDKRALKVYSMKNARKIAAQASH